MFWGRVITHWWCKMLWSLCTEGDRAWQNPIALCAAGSAYWDMPEQGFKYKHHFPEFTPFLSCIPYFPLVTLCLRNTPSLASEKRTRQNLDLCTATLRITGEWHFPFCVFGPKYKNMETNEITLKIKSHWKLNHIKSRIVLKFVKSITSS